MTKSAGLNFSLFRTTGATLRNARDLPLLASFAGKPGSNLQFGAITKHMAVSSSQKASSLFKLSSLRKDLRNFARSSPSDTVACVTTYSRRGSPSSRGIFVYACPLRFALAAGLLLPEAANALCGS